MVLRSFGNKSPTLGSDVYVDESAVVIGEVFLRDRSSVWPGAVLRADDDIVEIGRGSAMMDMSFAEAPKGRSVVVGNGCIVSHSARLHGCKVGDETLVGIGALILDGAEVPLRVYFAHGLAKLELGLGRGKRQYEKRQAIAEREHRREMERAARRRR